MLRKNGNSDGTLNCIFDFGLIPMVNVQIILMIVTELNILKGNKSDGYLNFFSTLNLPKGKKTNGYLKFIPETNFTERK